MTSTAHRQDPFTESDEVTAAIERERLRERRHGAHREPPGLLRCGDHVHLHQLELPGAAQGQALDDRPGQPAEPAPGRPQLHQHRQRRLLRHRGEVVVAGGGDPRQGMPAVPADRHPRPDSGYPVAPSAPGAADDARARLGCGDARAQPPEDPLQRRQAGIP